MTYSRPYSAAGIVLLCLLFISLFISCAEDNKDLSRFSKIIREFPAVSEDWLDAAENPYFTLRINQATAAVELTEKSTGKVWLSNPAGDDPQALGINQSILHSQFRIRYFNDSSIRKDMNSWDDSVSKGQFKIDKTDAGASVTYTLGEIDSIRLIPGAIRAERFEEILEKVTDNRYSSQMKRQFDLVSLEKARTKESKQALIEKYPQVEKYDFYNFSNLTNKAVLERIEAGFIQAGYTIEDLIRDNEENDIAADKPNVELFTITIHYDLEGDVFKVRIPTNEIIYHPSFPLTNLRLMEFFGASLADIHDGYMLVPDGSGALIDLDNGKTWADIYYTQVYNDDPSVPVKELGVKQSKITQPVFGMKQDESAFFAVIEEGDAHASIYADVAGRVNSYNYIGSEYSILSHAPVTLESLQGNKYVNTYQQRPFNGEIRIAYHFLQGEDADYTGMAKGYAEYIFKDEPADPLGTRPEVALDVVMNVDKMQRFLGIPYEGEEVLTTYEELTSILDDLEERGVNTRVVNLLGWERNGLNHDASIKRSGKVGSKKDMKNFISYSSEKGDILFFDASVTRVLKNSSFDGYSQGFNTVKLLDRKDAVMYPFSIATKTKDRTLPEYYLVSPVRGSGVYDNAVQAVEKYELPGFGFRFAGYEIHSEYFERQEVPRQNAISYTENLFDRIEEQGAHILLRGGNSYTLDNASFITEVELSSSNYLIADRSVPFIPLVLSGHRQYSGKPINLEDSERTSFLRLLETGAVPLFKIIHEDNSLLVNTFHDDLYSVTYENWADQIEDWVHELQAVRTELKNSSIKEHRYISDEAVAVMYENGVTIIVNYGKDAVEYNEVVVSGEDYAIVR